MQPTAHLVITGSGNWTNNGTVTCNTGSWVHMTGNAIQTIQGASTTSFSNIDINNSNSVNVATNVTVNSNLQLTLGYFDLKNSTVTFGNTASVTGVETETKRIRSTDAGGFEGQGTGIITTTRNNPTGNVANLGLDFTPTAALGSTVIIRGHKEQNGTGSYAGNKSVFRYYDIQPTTQSNVTINSFNYFDAELGTQAANEANLEMFQWIQVGAPQWWSPRTTTGASSVTNYVASTTTTNTLLTYKVTLGSNSSPLPINLLSFKAECNNGQNNLLWQTSSEQNNDYFTLEKSINGIDFNVFTQVPSQGNSNTLQNYSAIDYTPFYGTNYYRLKQTDLDGQYTYSNIVSLNCTYNNITEDLLLISPSDGTIEVIVKGYIGNTYNFNITNLLGQIIINKKITLSDYQQKITLSAYNLSKGMYYVIMQTENKNISKPVIIK